MDEQIPVKRADRCISAERLSDTGFSYTLSLISGKYKMTILYTLMEFGVVRYNELQRYIKASPSRRFRAR